MLFKTTVKTSKKFKGLGCINCPNNKYKSGTIRDTNIISDSDDLDVLFILESDNDQLFDLIDKHLSKYNIGFSYLTKCNILDLKPTAPEISCCKKQIKEVLKNINTKIIVGFNSHFLTWLYDIYYDVRMWKGKFCPIKFNEKDTWQYTCLNYNDIENIRHFEQKNYWKQLEIDLKNLDNFLKKDYQKPVVCSDHYEDGIEIISGLENNDYNKLKATLERFKSYPYIAIDIENSPLKPWNKNEYYPNTTSLASIAIGTFDEVVSFPIEHPKCWGAEHDKVLDLLEDFLLNSGTKICHNLKHELQWFYWYFGKEILFETEWVDTQSLSYIIDHRTMKERNQGMHGLGKLTLQHYGFNLKDQKEIDFTKMFDEPIIDLLTYNGRDTKWTYKLYFDMIKKLSKSQEWIFDFHNKDCVTWAIAEAEGYKCNTKQLNEFERGYKKKLLKVEKDIFSLPEIKNKFDITSSKQLSQVFEDKYNINLPKSDKGNSQTDESVLNDLTKKGNKLAKLVLLHRSLSKKLSTYVIGMSKFLHPDGYFHSEFNAHFTRTGRKSSQFPNAQNFPKRKGKEIRKIVIPKKDCVIIAVDYGQIEARGYCMASNETSFIEKIKNGIDIHMYWAKRILELYPDAYEIKEEKDYKVYRNIVKNRMVFPSFYGAGVYSMTRNLNLLEEIMKEIYDEFWGDFPKIKEWQEKTLSFYQNHGYIETLTGRKLIGKSEKSILSINDIFNWPIQGTCSDIVCDAANRLSELSYKTNNKAIQPALNVHDDLTFTQVPVNRIEETCEIIMKEMCKADFDFIGDVPLQVELAVGENWCDMEDKYVKDTRDFNYD